MNGNDKQLVDKIIKSMRTLPNTSEHNAFCTLYPEYNRKHKQLLEKHYNLVGKIATWAEPDIAFPGFEKYGLHNQNPLVR